ncbi:MAG TPA: IPT/TIG domain-containing protein [Methanoregula sp.]|nr:IPT/TIG domain-containing protein [Methanoregula sp.]
MSPAAGAAHVVPPTPRTVSLPSTLEAGKNLIHRCAKDRIMTGNSPFCLLFSFLLVFSVFFAGCSEEPASAGTTALPTHPDAKYGAGDIIATSSSATAPALYVILNYDAATDQYTRGIIEKNTDGSWGHRTSTWVEKSPRTEVEKIYTVKVGHVVISIVPVVSPTLLSEPPQSSSGTAPVISNISPGFAVRDTVVSVTISGTNFQKGATVRLVRVGSAAINATVVRVTAFDISCLFNLKGKSDGVYTLIVTNPDGKSDSQPGIFTIGEASPIIAGMYPVTGAVHEKVSLVITGQNFRNEVKVSLMKNATELVCDGPLSMESSKISCSLDLAPNRGASPGEWTVTVLNIRDQQRGTWVKKFIITNATTGSP